MKLSAKSILFFLKWIAIIGFSLATLYMLYFFKEHMYLLKNPCSFKKFILSFGTLGMLVFIFSQVVQVVIFFIPGEIMQIAGGYAYGTLLGSFLSIIGISIGSVIVFLLSRKYGRSFVEKIVSTNCLNKFEKILNSKKINLLVFILYLLPCMPKDSLIFICGVSKISLKNFLIYSTLGRIPYLFASCYFAANAFSGNKILLASTAIILTILIILGVIKGNKLISYAKQ